MLAAKSAMNLAMAFKAYELVHPGDGLRAALTQQPAPKGNA